MGDVIPIRQPSIVEKLAYAPHRRYHVIDFDGRPVWETDDLAIAEANQRYFPGSEIVDTASSREEQD